MAVDDWWGANSEERYWMVAPKGGSVGEALIAPRSAGARTAHWSHDLVAYTRPGDTLFVWDRSLARPGIAAWGRVLGPLTETSGVRGGRETPQWHMPVSDSLRLARPITLLDLRRIGPEIAAIQGTLREQHDGLLHLPFIGESETLVPAPTYLTKFPRDLVALVSSAFGFEFAL